MYLTRAHSLPAAGDQNLAGRGDQAAGNLHELTEHAFQQLLLVLLALGGAWFLAGRALVPIQRTVARRRAFIADASHELRTPLAVLRVAADLLYQRRHQPLAATEPLIADLRLEIARLERLAGDLLALARSDLGELGLAVGELDLAALVGEVVRRTLPVAEERGIALRSAGTDGAATIEGDPDRLQQVVLILLDNALWWAGAVPAPGGRRDP
jgi:signal transduction histidine kinase